jgi:multidrug resistance efflux pump
VDFTEMDVEDFQQAWRRARAAWARANQHKLETETAGGQLTSAEQASWQAAKAHYDEYERGWDQMYAAGVVVVVGGDDEDDDEPGPATP